MGLDDPTRTPCAMISPEDFAELAADLAKLNGLDLKTASALLGQIGDTPELSEEGLVTAVWQGKEYQLRWPDEDLDS